MADSAPILPPTIIHHLDRKVILRPINHALDHKLALPILPSLCDLERFQRVSKLESMREEGFEIDQTLRD